MSKTSVSREDIKNCVEFDEEFQRFMSYVEDATDYVKYHLEYVRFPLFVCFYIFLLPKRQTHLAMKYAPLLGSRFLTIHNYYGGIHVLFEMKTVTELIQHQYFKNYYNRKHEITLPVITKAMFLQLLKNLNCFVMSFVLQDRLRIPFETLEELYRNLGDSLPSDFVPPITKKKKSTRQGTEDVVSWSSPQNYDVPEHYDIMDELTMCHCAIDCENTEMTCVDISKNNSKFAYGLNNSQIHVQMLDLDDLSSRTGIDEHVGRRCSKRTTVGNYSSAEQHLCLSGHKKEITAITFLNPALLMSCSRDSTARVWDLPNCTSQVFRGHKKSVLHIAANYDDYAHFATGGEDCSARLWNIRSGTSVLTLNHNAIVDFVTFNQGSNCLATASSDRRIRIWSLNSGCCLWTLPSHQTYINWIEFSPNKKYMACGDDEGGIKIWDLVSQKVYSETKAYTDPIYHLSFNRSSSILSSCSSNGCIKLWDTINPLEDGSHAILGEQQPNGVVPMVSKICYYNLLVTIGTIQEA